MNNRLPGVMMNLPPEKSMLKGKVIQSQSREIVANVFAFMKREAELGPQIPFRCVTKRVIAATGVSERTIRRIQREAEIVFSGQAASFVSPRQKKKRQKKTSGSGNEEESNTVKTERLEPGSPKRNKMLYPSLEDMKVDQMTKAQQRYSPLDVYHHHMDPRPITSNPQCLYPSLSPPPMYPTIEHSHGDIQGVNEATLPYAILPSAPPAMMATPKSSSTSLYPSLGEFMGLELSEELVAQNVPDYRVAVPAPMEMSISMHTLPSTTVGGMIAPLSGQSPGLQRAHVTNGIRELTICKGADGKVGLRMQAVNDGIFVGLVVKDSPAALVGLRFGDQILQVNGICVSGYTMEQVHKVFRDSPINGISVVVRDRPFERTVTLHKNSTGHVGFNFKNGKIIGIVPDSSAARNGLLTNHHILEINGQNMVRVDDKEIRKSMEECGPSVTVTIIPSFVFDHMIKKMPSNLIKNAMDHSIPSI